MILLFRCVAGLYHQETTICMHGLFVLHYYYIYKMFQTSLLLRVKISSDRLKLPAFFKSLVVQKRYKVMITHDTYPVH